MSRIRVVQWATGGVGRASVEAILRHPDLELVGCWVHAAEKHGQDVGEIVGIGPIGVTATTDAEEILALDADAVVYAPILPHGKEVAALLASGKNVVTPVGWFYPEPGRTDRIDEACRVGGTTLHGTGINPGGATDLHPILFSSLTSAVTFVRGEEFTDIRSYAAPDVLRGFMGFGGTPEESMQGPMLQMLSGGFLQSVRMCLDALGFAEAEIVPTQEVAVASARIEETPIGPIEPGQVAARRFAWEAKVGDRVVVRVAVNWLMGEEHLDPPWTLGAEGQRYEVEVQGDPDTFAVDPRLAPHVDRGRSGPQPRHRRHRRALRELDPVRRRRRARHQDLPRPAADRRPGAPRPFEGGIS